MSLDQQTGAPGYYGAPAPGKRRTSGLAVAGLVFAFVGPPVGFILSLIAVFKTGAGKAAGRGLAIAGLVISLLIMGGAIAAVVTLSNSTLADPGCTTGKDVILTNAAGVNDPQALQSMIDGLNKAAAEAKHDNVRDAMKALADDYTALQQGVSSGQLPPDIMTRVTTDAQKIDELCSV
ncbi:DUF4190 domain-containing protein [Dactylosporangium sp. NPDC051541]|uniref:DUF4190 domain-containing protein n=1 Tax=Dactylosporangium sp. NPDC051541 TaxID=3363977 RepID=UPI0037B70A70